MITRWVRDPSGYIIGASKIEGEFVTYEDHLEAVEDLEIEAKFWKHKYEAVMFAIKTLESESIDKILK